MQGQGKHEWAIEFSKTPDDLAAFETLLDQKLQALNSDYRAKRSGDLAMGKLSVVPLHIGTFYQWLKSKQKLGSQQKIPRLSNERKFIDQVKNLSDSLI